MNLIMIICDLLNDKYIIYFFNNLLYFYFFIKHNKNLKTIIDFYYNYQDLIFRIFFKVELF